MYACLSPVYLCAGCAEASHQLVLEDLKAVTSKLHQVALETRSQTRSASKINAQDLRRFQMAANVEVIGTAAAMSFEDLQNKAPEAGGFEW